MNQHIEDTAHCPNFVRGRVYKLVGKHLDLGTVSNYISLYEVLGSGWYELLKSFDGPKA